MPIQPITRSSAPVLAAIADASAESGVDFGYLLRQARVESGLDATARAATSSARGLYQFIDSTWLALVARHGARVGLDNAASALRSGQLDGAARAGVLALRDNPAISARLAAWHAADNAGALAAATGQASGQTELYLAHFLGAGGAARFLTARAANGSRPAAEIFPAAARSNPGIFGGQATPRSLDDVYTLLAARLGDGGAPGRVVGEIAATPRGMAARLAYLTLAALDG